MMDGQGLRPAMMNNGQVPKEKEFSRAYKHDLSSPPHQKSFARISLEDLGGSKIYIISSRVKSAPALATSQSTSTRVGFRIGEWRVKIAIV